MSAPTGNVVTATRLAADELRGLLESQLAGLRASEVSVIRLVLDAPEFVAASTTAEVAARAGVSAPTVVRAARAVGFDGFADLKLGLAYARGSARFFTPPSDVDETAGPAAVLAATLDGSRRALLAAEGAIDPESLGRAAQALGSARRVLVVGAGPSTAVAADVAFRLVSIGIVATSVPDHMSALINARLLEQQDVVIAVSATGRTPATLAVSDAALSSGATLIALTNQVAAPLGQLADITIAVGGGDLLNQMAASASRISHLAAMDAVLALLALRHPDLIRRAERAGTDLPPISD